MAYEFAGQLRDEEVILVTRQHPFVLFRPLFASGLLLLVPVAYFSFFNEVRYLYVLIPLCLVLAGIKGFSSYHSWVNTMMLLTDKRVIILTQKSVTQRELISSGVDRVHRVTHKINGLFPTLFSYGSLFVATDDPNSAIALKAVADPFEIQQEILRAVFGDTN